MEAGYDIGIGSGLGDENLTSKSGVRTNIKGQIVNAFSFGGLMVRWSL